MWRTGLVPYSSASTVNRCSDCSAAREGDTSAPPSKSQTERKMSCECKSISRLFQVFINQSLPPPSISLSLSLPPSSSLMIFLLRSATPSFLSPAVTNASYNYFLPPLYRPPFPPLPFPFSLFSFLISHTAILLLFFLLFCLKV